VVKAFQGETYGESQRDLLRCARERGVPMEVAFDELSESDREWVLRGDPEYADDPEAAWEGRRWYGVQGFFDYFE
jgi:excinuclease ABC subunit A